mmetsp:Transcript_28036/g.73983  ORF Transcript_28036/g.73983 Transcript_28036/m.73983 type:complete len:215 (+) Transcript_28036:21-665(+)
MSTQPSRLKPPSTVSTTTSRTTSISKGDKTPSSSTPRTAAVSTSLKNPERPKDESPVKTVQEKKTGIQSSTVKLGSTRQSLGSLVSSRSPLPPTGTPPVVRGGKSVAALRLGADRNVNQTSNIEQTQQNVPTTDLSGSANIERMSSPSDFPSQRSGHNHSTPLESHDVAPRLEMLLREIVEISSELSSFKLQVEHCVTLTFTTIHHPTFNQHSH